VPDGTLPASLTKHCPGCAQRGRVADVPLSAFGADKRSRDGLQVRCRRCRNESHATRQRGAREDQVLARLPPEERLRVARLREQRDELLLALLGLEHRVSQLEAARGPSPFAGGVSDVPLDPHLRRVERARRAEADTGGEPALLKG